MSIASTSICPRPTKALTALDAAIDRRAELLDEIQRLHAEHLRALEDELALTEAELKTKLFAAVPANEKGTRERTTLNGNRLLHLQYDREVIDAEALEANVSKGTWYKITTRVIDKASFDAARKLGQIPAEAIEVAVSTKPVAPSLREG